MSDEITPEIAEGFNEVLSDIIKRVVATKGLFNLQENVIAELQELIDKAVETRIKLDKMREGMNAPIDKEV